MQPLLPKVIAHRGAPYHAPENTVPALEAAKKHGATWVEFDVMLTLDDVPVVIHDKTVNRTTNGRGRVANTPYHSLRKLDAGSWFNCKFVNTRIPTLAEVLCRASDLNLGINIEMKGQIGKEAVLAQKILTSLEKYWNPSLPAPLISSFSVENLIAFKKLKSQYPIAYNTDRWQTRYREIACNLNCYSIHMNKATINEKRVSDNTAYGLHTLAYTVNSKAEADKIFKCGVCCIFSDLISLYEKK